MTVSNLSSDGLVGGLLELLRVEGDLQSRRLGLGSLQITLSPSPHGDSRRWGLLRQGFPHSLLHLDRAFIPKVAMGPNITAVLILF